ncbi:MAG: hypothetical protein IPG81_28695 [Sandaracinaceae bacterium]|nr:hypothetical protein [Sandaracinaceae bacterium]
MGRKIVGWGVNGRSPTLAALLLKPPATARRPSKGIVLHSDNGRDEGATMLAMMTSLGIGRRSVAPREP